MAFVKDDEEEKLGQPQAQGNETVLSSGGGSGPMQPGASAAAPAQGQAPQKPKGTGWTNLVNYVDANKPQAQDMAQKVVGNVGQKADAAKGASSVFATGANQTITNQTPKRDDSIIKDIGTNAASVANDAERRKQFESMQTAKYQGPNAASEVEGYTDVAQNVQGVAKGADDLEDFEKRRNTITEAYTPRTDYTRGESRLDSFLVGQGPARDTILEGKGNFGTGSQFTKDWEDLVTGIDTNIGTADASAKQLAKDTNDALTGATDATRQRFTGYNDAATQANDANKATFDRLTTQLTDKNPNVRNKAFAEIGLDTGTGEWLLKNGAKMTDLIAAGKARAAGDFAKDDEIAQFQALSSLMPGGLDANLATRTGAEANAFKSNQEKITQARDAKALQDTLESRLKTQQAKRDQEYAVYNDAVTSAMAGPSAYSKDPVAHLQPLARLTGIDANTLANAQAKGMDMRQFLKKGANLNIGDVATDKERSGWASLLGKIGINPAYDTKDRQDEGAAYSFDQASMQAAINQLLAPKPIAQASKDNQQAEKDPQKILEQKLAHEKAVAKTTATAPINVGITTAPSGTGSNTNVKTVKKRLGF